MTPTTVYLHGAPGSPTELEAFAPAGFDAVAPDRFTTDPRMPLATYLDRTAVELRHATTASPTIRLVGFSLGARVALELATRLGDLCEMVELISPAAPLELGCFLPRMKGAPLFRAARLAPATLRPITWMQAQAATLAPGPLVRGLFSNSAEADARLISEPRFASNVARSLRRSYQVGSAGFRREILAYVRPWSGILAHVHAPVRIWQGSLDDWTPPDMAQALREALPNALPVRTLTGLSHFSTLKAALRQIAADQPRGIGKHG